MGSNAASRSSLSRLAVENCGPSAHLAAARSRARGLIARPAAAPEPVIPEPNQATVPREPGSSARARAVSRQYCWWITFAYTYPETVQDPWSSYWRSSFSTPLPRPAHHTPKRALKPAFLRHRRKCTCRKCMNCMFSPYSTFTLVLTFTYVHCTMTVGTRVSMYLENVRALIWQTPLLRKR